jgi:hypothetical protein
MSPTKSTKQSAKSAGRKGFTAEERAAMRERVREMKAGSADGEGEVLAKIAAMPESDRVLAERIHATLGFSDKANLDDGGMWPTDYALN